MFMLIEFHCGCHVAFIKKINKIKRKKQSRHQVSCAMLGDLLFCQPNKWFSCSPSQTHCAQIYETKAQSPFNHKPAQCVTRLLVKTLHKWYPCNRKNACNVEIKGCLIYINSSSSTSTIKHDIELIWSLRPIRINIERNHIN